MKNWILFSFLIVSMGTFAQLTNKMEKLAGKWKYKEGSGFEIWSVNGNELLGKAYRVNVKALDSVKVEDIRIARVNKNMVYTMQTYKYAKDTVLTQSFQFVANKRSFKFYNVNEGAPYRIEYRFGFLNRNKLKIKIQYISTDKKPLKLVLFKMKTT